MVSIHMNNDTANWAAILVGMKSFRRAHIPNSTDKLVRKAAFNSQRLGQSQQIMLRRRLLRRLVSLTLLRSLSFLFSSSECWPIGRKFIRTVLSHYVEFQVLA